MRGGDQERKELGGEQADLDEIARGGCFLEQVTLEVGLVPRDGVGKMGVDVRQHTHSSGSKLGTE